MSRTVLAVDDERGALTLLTIMLERGGYDVHQAQDGYRALHMLDDFSPELFILDVMMPGMDGIELCREIRARRQHQHTPIVMLSARGDPASVQAALDAGATDYLQKPVLHHDLIMKLQKILEQPA